MTHRFAWFALAFGLLSSAAHAGTISTGQWTASTCGAVPTPVDFNLSSVEAFNKSATAVKKWQTAASTYSNCIVHEATDDNNTITKSVNDTQDRLKGQFDKANADMKKAQSKFNG